MGQRFALRANSLAYVDLVSLAFCSYMQSANFFVGNHASELELHIRIDSYVCICKSQSSCAVSLPALRSDLRHCRVILPALELRVRALRRCSDGYAAVLGPSTDSKSPDPSWRKISSMVERCLTNSGIDSSILLFRLLERLGTHTHTLFLRDGDKAIFVNNDVIEKVHNLALWHIWDNEILRLVDRIYLNDRF